ncbi:alpha/beta hydrolase [Gorillibacterium sp. CAU 1737]|uniref:alpha/beta fold hydrolase n=1 Tax=Gorillibacterium sp. CAU 1737 TaxID=3140362 RepID=UPI00326102C1
MIEKMIQLGNMRMNVRYLLNDNPVVLFLHFSGGNMKMWEGILPQFEKEYSLIVPDLRGHGKSDKPLTGYHIDEMANDLFLLLKHFDIKECHIVGSSMGAEIGLSLAAAHPELVESLVCEGALYNEFGEYGLFNGSEEEIEHKKEAMRTELAKREERIYTKREAYIEEEREKLTQLGIWNDSFHAFFENNLQQQTDGTYTYCYLNRVRTEYIQQYWDVKFEDYYKKITCPILFLPSEEERNDERVKTSFAAFTRLLDSFEVEPIPNSIHAYVWMQLPHAAGEAVKKFIKNSVSWQ